MESGNSFRLSSEHNSPSSLRSSEPFDHLSTLHIISVPLPSQLQRGNRWYKKCHIIKTLSSFKNKSQNIRNINTTCFRYTSAWRALSRALVDHVYSHIVSTHLHQFWLVGEINRDFGLCIENWFSGVGLERAVNHLEKSGGVGTMITSKAQVLKILSKKSARRYVNIGVE